jgi:hypothetical protein
MKIMNRLPVAACSIVSAFLFSSAHCVAQLAVGIVADAPRAIQWAQEEILWNEEIATNRLTAQNTGQLVTNTQQLIQNTNDLLERLGRTSNAVSQSASTIPRSTGSLETSVKLATRQDTLSTAMQRYSLNQVPLIDKNNPEYAIATSYAVFGQDQKRVLNRYAPFAAQQAMSDRFQTSAENAEQLEKEELTVQADAVDRLRSATTQAEIEVCNVAIEASKGRLDLAHAKMNQAKAELDGYITKVGIEKERKAEADREWTQSVVAGLRDRALKAYQASSGQKSEDGT